MAPPILSFEDLGLIQGEGWLFRIRPADPADTKHLISADDYARAIEGNS